MLPRVLCGGVYICTELVNPLGFLGKLGPAGSCSPLSGAFPLSLWVPWEAESEVELSGQEV